MAQTSVHSNQTREFERNALHSTIWKVANELRGSVDGWDFKMYVLGFLFYRFLRENLTKYVNEKYQEFDRDFNYENLKDSEVNKDSKTSIVNEKGFCNLPKC